MTQFKLCAWEEKQAQQLLGDLALLLPRSGRQGRCGQAPLFPSGGNLQLSERPFHFPSGRTAPAPSTSHSQQAGSGQSSTAATVPSGQGATATGPSHLPFL